MFTVPSNPDFDITSLMNLEGDIVPNDALPFSLHAEGMNSSKDMIMIPLLFVTLNLTYEEKEEVYRKHRLLWCSLDTIRGKEKVRKELDLNDCMTAFSSREQLGDDDAWYCPKCKKHVRAYKEMTLWRLPEILIVHLKRFKVTGYNSMYSNVSKIDRAVRYPPEFSVEPYLAPGAPGALHQKGSIRAPLYDLFATSIHSGSPSGGHYWANVFNFRTKRWSEMDDSRVYVQPVGNLPPTSKDAYVLFYRMRSSEVGREVFPPPERSLAIIDHERGSEAEAKISLRQCSCDPIAPTLDPRASLYNNNDVDDQSDDGSIGDSENRYCV
jgi:hypothetical protein